MKTSTDKTDIIFKLAAAEQQRQTDMIGLIPSENHTSPQVRQIQSSTLSSKYSEGYAGRRYYEGNEYIDQIERLAIERVQSLFDVPYVNVQPYSGSPANLAVYFALMQPGDTLLGLRLAMGGHLTHGHPKVTASGAFYNAVQFGVREDARIDYDEVRALAHKHKPKVIVAGNTAYPFELDFKKFREIADEVGAWLHADVSHVTGLIVGGQHQSPAPYADTIMSTTHKTFRGPRGAMIMVTKRGLERDSGLGKKIDSAIIPGLQGGPHNERTAAIALAAQEAARPQFQNYAAQIRANADALAKGLLDAGLKLVGGGTATHLMVLDLTPLSDGLGTQVSFAMNVAGMYANRNTVPHEPCSPFYPSGVRIGTPLVTTRGMKEKDMRQIAKWMSAVVDEVKSFELPSERSERSGFLKNFRKAAQKNETLLGIKQEVHKLASTFPLFTWGE